jgi:hypothetical protein
MNTRTVLVIVSILLIQLQSHAADTKAAAEKVRIAKVAFNSVSTKEALDALSKQSGIAIHLTPSNNQASITLDLKDVPAAEAFRYVAELANLDLIYKADGAHFTPKS